MMKAVSSTELGLDTMTLPDFEKLTTEEVIEHLHVQDSERAFCVYEPSSAAWRTTSFTTSPRSTGGSLTSCSICRH